MTLEDAAGDLHGRLKGLDSELEGSQRAVEELRNRVDETSDEIEREWTHLAAAVQSLLDGLQQEQELMVADVRDVLQATAEAAGAVRESGAQARSGIADGRGALEMLVQRAAEIEPGVEALAVEAGEAPALRLSRTAREAEQELARTCEEARDFLREDIANAVAQLAADAGNHCAELRASLADEGAGALQTAFNDWDAAVAALEGYVGREGFLVSHPHARAVVEWALGECHAALEAQVESLAALVAEAVLPLEKLAAELGRVSEMLAAGGAELTGELVRVEEDLDGASGSLGAVRDLLRSYTFVQG